MDERLMVGTHDYAYWVNLSWFYYDKERRLLKCKDVDLEFSVL